MQFLFLAKVELLSEKLNIDLVEPYYMQGSNPDELKSITFHKNKL